MIYHDSVGLSFCKNVLESLRCLTYLQGTLGQEINCRDWMVKEICPPYLSLLCTTTWGVLLFTVKNC